MDSTFEVGCIWGLSINLSVSVLLSMGEVNQILKHSHQQDGQLWSNLNIFYGFNSQQLCGR